MAKMYNGYMGGFSGKLGPAVGYMWNGKWCLRSRPTQVRNPRTPEQTAHRTLFREEVRFAARMRRAAEVGLTVAARDMGMTCFNLFVSINQQAFSLVDGGLRVDHSALTVSVGPVAPVGFGAVRVEEGNVLKVSFEKNPTHAVANGYDRVMVYAYCPDEGDGIMSAPAYRRDKQLSYCLPDEYIGHEVHLYGLVQDDEGRCSESVYLGTLPPQDSGIEDEPRMVEVDGGRLDPETGEWIAAGDGIDAAANGAEEAPPPPLKAVGRGKKSTYSNTLKE